AFRAGHVPDLRTQAEIRRGVEARVGAGDFLGLAVTNLGSQRALQRATGLEVLDYRSVANRNGGLFALALHVTFVGGAARLTFTFPRPLTPDVLARTVLDQTFDRLENWS
ncbi:MAG: hypothetical protein GX458_03145, partial [Phyllobacteriaceae bacterium]|nr:hypothetical protein [Phyllobacteriaceae bacterium]